jgi:hypothetical protein
MVSPLVQALAGVAVAVGADVVAGAVVVAAGAGAVVVAAGAGAVVVAAGAGAVVVAAGAGAVVVAAGAGAVVVAAGAGAVVVAAGAGAVVVAVGGAVLVVVGVAVGVTVAPLATVKFDRRLEVVPSDHVSTNLMVCDPSTSFFVSYGTAVPSAAVPAKSKGGSVSVRTGGFVPARLSR